MQDQCRKEKGFIFFKTLPISSSLNVTNALRAFISNSSLTWNLTGNQRTVVVMNLEPSTLDPKCSSPVYELCGLGKLFNALGSSPAKWGRSILI